MYVIMEKELIGRLSDGINAILNLDDVKFQQVLNSENKSFYFCYLNDIPEFSDYPIQSGIYDSISNKFIYYAYLDTDIIYEFSISEVLEQMSVLLPSFPQDSIEYKRISSLLQSKDIDAFKLRYLNGISSQFSDKAFEILQNQEVFEMFLDFDNNKDFFSINGRTVHINEYLSFFYNLLDSQSEYPQTDLSYRDIMSNEYYIPDVSAYKSRYLQISSKNGMFLNQKRILSYSNKVYAHKIAQEDEVKWEINPELYAAVYDGMPDNLSLEEKALYIYCRLCKMLLYDDAFFYDRTLPLEERNPQYKNGFSKERLESIIPGSPIICFDFSRILAKFLNQLDNNNLKAIMLSTPNGKHYNTCFYSDKISVALEPISNRSYSTNDLMKTKYGLALEGVTILNDGEKILSNSLDSIYFQATGRKSTSISDCVDIINPLPPEDISVVLEKKINSFIESMKLNHLVGNEVIEAFLFHKKSGFFGYFLDISLIGKLQENKISKTFTSMILINPNNNSSDMYLLDTHSLSLTRCISKEVIDKLNSGEYKYENERCKMPGLEGNR